MGLFRGCKASLGVSFDVYGNGQPVLAAKPLGRFGPSLLFFVTGSIIGL